jgi:hypothetical protein
MTHTVEDAIEILAGERPRVINIRIDYSEKNLIKSIARQVSNGIALTDRQLDLVLKKIQKYQGNLEKNNIDVNRLLLLKPLRQPLREIDRSQTISISANESGKSIIAIKGIRSKNFQEKWNKIANDIIGDTHDVAVVREVVLNETNVALIVSTFNTGEFNISDDLLEIFEEIEKIQENPSNFVPYIALENDKVVVKNANKHFIKYAEETFSAEAHNNFLGYIDKLKACGFYLKNPEILEKIEKLAPTKLVNTILTTDTTRLRVDPTKHSIDQLINAIEVLDQWPLLVLVDDDQRALEQVTSVYSVLSNKIPNSDITVFFRVDNGQKNFNEFTQFVKDNQLNNYIGSNTKVVFIAKNKIPKPLLKASWTPRTAILMSSYDFGKTSAFLDDLSTVYYYNVSVAMRNNKIKGARQIAQL